MDTNVLRRAARRHPTEIMQPYDSLLGLEGVDAILAFTELLGGMMVYIPNTRTVFTRCLELEVQREFNGHNSARLAKKYGFAERHIRRMAGCP